MTEENKQFIELCQDSMKKMFKDFQHLHPIAFSLNSKMQLDVLPLFFLQSDNYVENLTTCLLHYIKKEKPNQIIFITEGSMVSYEGEKNTDAKIDRDYEKFGSIRNFPQSIEIISLILWTKQISFTRIWKIHETNNIKTLVFFEEKEETIGEEITKATNLKNPFINPTMYN